MHCLERGYLMGKIWWSEMELFQRLLQLRHQSERDLASERERHASEREQLLRRIDELTAEVRCMLPTPLFPRPSTGSCDARRAGRRRA